MPLPFDSISHGIIPFGFFNIKTDMLFLNDYAFFLTSFCDLLNKIKFIDEAQVLEWNVLQFNDKDAIGDLHGAISGTIFKGFIGSVYKYFPFPKKLSLFKQDTYGYFSQKKIFALAKGYISTTRIKVIIKLDPKIIHIGSYVFSFRVFDQMLYYVESGGYPGWENNVFPECVKILQWGRIKKYFSGYKSS